MYGVFVCLLQGLSPHFQERYVVVCVTAEYIYVRYKAYV